MLQAALEYVFKKAEAAAQERLARVVKEIQTDGRVQVVEHDGELIDRPVPPPLRKHLVDSVDDLIRAAKRYNTDPVVWINGDQVVLVPDDDDRRELVTLTLVKTEVFKKLEALAHSAASVMDQATLVRLLRREFRKAVNQSNVLPAVRRIKWRQHDSGSATFQHGNESLGRTIENEVSGAGDIPELLVVPTPVYLNPGEEAFEAQIGLDLEIDAAAQRFILRPLPDEIRVAINGATESIRDRITDALGSDVPVFFGTP